jgi:hypothetical protein
LDRDASRYFLERWERVFRDVADWVYAVELDCMPKKVGFLVWEIFEVESSAGWVPFVEEDGRVLIFAVVVEEGNVDPFFL